MVPYHPFQLNFWYYYLIQMRPYLLFVSGAAGLMGMAVGYERYPDVSPTRLLLAFPPFFLAYGFGQALTDCFQTDTDRISAPERPLSNWSATVQAGHLLAIAAIGVFAPFLSKAGIAAWTAWVLATAFALFGQWHAAKVKNQDQAASLFAISCTVRTFLLLQWAAILVFQPGWIWGGIFFYTLFEVVLYFRHERNQV